MNILIIIAHPDDETIWCGTVIKKLIEKKCNITVISVTGKNEYYRAKEFEKAARELGFKYILLPMKYPTDESRDAVISISSQIQIHIFQNEFEYDFILSHSPVGEENNHPHHIQTHYEALKIANDFEIPFVFFNGTPNKKEIIELLKVHFLKQPFLLNSSLNLLRFFKTLNLKKSPLNSFKILTSYGFLFLRFHTFSPFKFCLIFESDLKWKQAFIKTNYESISNPIMALNFINHPFEYLISSDQEVLQKILSTVSD